MDAIFNTLTLLREKTVALIDNLTEAQINKVPDGFNNNIVWNAAHLVAAMQGVCYKRSEVPMFVTEAFFQKYKPESKPEGIVDMQELKEIKELLVTSVAQLKEDYNNGIFKTYTAFTTRYGVPITNIDEAIQFLPFHEGLHAGYIMALKRMV